MESYWVTQVGKEKVSISLVRYSSTALILDRKNQKGCGKFLLDCAFTLLQTYGVYPFFFLVGEPGTGIKSRVYVLRQIDEGQSPANEVDRYDFSEALGLGEVTVEDTYPMDDTLAVFHNHVQARAGKRRTISVITELLTTSASRRIGTAEAPQKPAKKSAKALDKLTAYEFDVPDFMGRDELLLRKEDWDEEQMTKQSLPAVHAIFRWAHGECRSKSNVI